MSAASGVAADEDPPYSEEGALSTTNTPGDLDPDVVITGQIGENPLSDFPHARHHCVVFPIHSDAVSGGARRHCPNCFCWVCDRPVSACPRWTEHCLAKPDNPVWQERRRRVQQSKMPPLLPEPVQPPMSAVPIVIPADTPHGVHAQHLNPIAVSEPVSMQYVSLSDDSLPAQRNLRGTYCICDIRDNELGALYTHNFKLKRSHSAVTPGLPYDKHFLGDFACVWCCKRCGRPPPVDAAALLDRKRKRERDELHRQRLRYG